VVVVFVFSVVLVGSECSVAFCGEITTRRGVDEEAGGSLSSLQQHQQQHRSGWVQQQHGGTNDGGEVVRHCCRCVVGFESNSMLWKQVQSFKHTEHKSKTDMQIKRRKIISNK